MEDCQKLRSIKNGVRREIAEPPLLVVGITHSQTGLVLRGRLRALRMAGFRVVLIASPGPLLDQIAAEEGVEALPIPIERKMAPLSDVVSLVRLCRSLLRLRPPIAEFSTPKAGLLGNLAAFLCGVPCRVYVLRGLRLETASGLTRRILKITEWLASACSHLVLCNSPSLRDQALKLNLVCARKVRYLGDGSTNGVDVERFAPQVLAAEPKQAGTRRIPVIGFVGRLTRDKGVPELIEAFDQVRETLPDCQLLMVGWYDASEDALDPALQHYIDHHPAILRTGLVADTAPYYQEMDVMVLPTWREGFPNVVLEAAASGVPVITTLATGSRDAVIPEVTGLLIPPGNPQAITEAVLQLLRDPERRQRMGVAARKWVVEHFANDRLQQLTIELYRELLDAKGREKAAVRITGAAATVD